DVCFCERNVTEIFDEKRVSAAAFVGPGVSEGGGDYVFQIALPPRRAGERVEVNDTDENSLTFVEERRQRVKSVKWVKRVKSRIYLVYGSRASLSWRSLIRAASAASLSAAFLLLP